MASFIVQDRVLNSAKCKLEHGIITKEEYRQIANAQRVHDAMHGLDSMDEIIDNKEKKQEQVEQDQDQDQEQEREKEEHLKLSDFKHILGTSSILQDIEKLTQVQALVSSSSSSSFQLKTASAPTIPKTAISSSLTPPPSPKQRPTPQTNAINHPGFWDVFISYTQREGESETLASELYHAFTAAGLNVWKDIKMGKLNEAAMKEGVENSKCVIAILSGVDAKNPNAYFNRTFCVKELTWAQSADIPIQPVCAAEDKKKIGSFLTQASNKNIHNLGNIDIIHLDRSRISYWKAGFGDVLKAVKAAIAKMTRQKKSTIGSRKKNYLRMSRMPQELAKEFQKHGVDETSLNSKLRRDSCIIQNILTDYAMNSMSDDASNSMEVLEEEIEIDEEYIYSLGEGNEIEGPYALEDIQYWIQNGDMNGTALVSVPESMQDALGNDWIEVHLLMDHVEKKEKDEKEGEKKIHQSDQENETKENTMTKSTTIIHVPEDISTLHEAVAKANASPELYIKIILGIGKHSTVPGAIKTMSSSKSRHMSRTENYLYIDVPIFITGTNEKDTIIIGGISVRGDCKLSTVVIGSSNNNNINNSVTISNLSIIDSYKNGIEDRLGLPLVVEDLTISNCTRGSGILTRGSSTTCELNRVTVEFSQCGVCAHAGSRIKATDLIVNRCEDYGVFSGTGGANIKLFDGGGRTCIVKNVRSGNKNYYGLCAQYPKSSIQLMPPLSLKEVAKENGGGGDSGGRGEVPRVVVVEI